MDARLRWAGVHNKRLNLYAGEAGQSNPRQVFSLTKPRDCYEIYRFLGSRKNDVYEVFVDNGRRPVKVYCDMLTDGGGWTVV